VAVPKNILENVTLEFTQAYNGVVAKVQPITTLPDLLNNFLFTENLHLQIQPNIKTKAEEQTLNLCKCQKQIQFTPQFFSRAVALYKGLLRKGTGFR